ncbi:MAG: DUF3795 domain-containing protein [Promethearchaeota archaeon]
MKETVLIAPCGLYCGACRSYLLLKKDLLEERGYKMGCKGCKIRDKNCAFIKRDCPDIRKKKIEYCFECEKIPCQNLKKLDNRYNKKYGINILENLRQIQDIGAEKWIKEQKKFYTCPKCGGEICVHDEECFDCGHNYNPNKIEKNFNY